MAIGKKFWDGKDKSGASFIKSIDINDMASMYTCAAQLKGIGKAKGVEMDVGQAEFYARRALCIVEANNMKPPKSISTDRELWDPES